MIARYGPEHASLIQDINLHSACIFSYIPPLTSMEGIAWRSTVAEYVTTCDAIGLPNKHPTNKTLLVSWLNTISLACFLVRQN